jgi:hypothetical protein
MESDSRPRPAAEGIYLDDDPDLERIVLAGYLLG